MRRIITCQSILAILRQHPEGISIPDLIRTHYPDLSHHEYTAIRQCVYPKLKQLEKYGYAEHTTITDHVRGGKRTTWRALDD